MAKLVDFGRELVQTKVIPKLMKAKSQEPTRASLVDSGLRFTFVTGPVRKCRLAIVCDNCCAWSLVFLGH